MKLWSLLVLLLGLSWSATAQTVNDMPLRDIDVEYVEIVGTQRFLSTKVTIQIDFGQNQSYWTAKDTRLKDVDGRRLRFNSMVDALNFMSKNGYEFVDSYAVTANNQNIYHYLLRRQKKD